MEKFSFVRDSSTEMNLSPLVSDDDDDDDNGELEFASFLKRLS